MRLDCYNTVIVILIIFVIYNLYRPIKLSEGIYEHLSNEHSAELLNHSIGNDEGMDTGIDVGMDIGDSDKCNSEWADKTMPPILKNCKEGTDSDCKLGKLQVYDTCKNCKENVDVRNENIIRKYNQVIQNFDVENIDNITSCNSPRRVSQGLGKGGSLLGRRFENRARERKRDKMT